RPPWSKQASHPEPEFGGDTPETWEHSAEVEVPFLQKTLTNFSVVSIITGEVDPERLAQALADRLDNKTLLVVSTDLSHYYPYDIAREKDARCVSAICDLDIDRMKAEEACGKTVVLTLLSLARSKGWKATLLDARNSGGTERQRCGLRRHRVLLAIVAGVQPRRAGTTAATGPTEPHGGRHQR